MNWKVNYMFTCASPLSHDSAKFKEGMIQELQDKMFALIIAPPAGGPITCKVSPHPTGVCAGCFTSMLSSSNSLAEEEEFLQFQKDLHIRRCPGTLFWNIELFCVYVWLLRLVVCEFGWCPGLGPCHLPGGSGWPWWLHYPRGRRYTMLYTWILLFSCHIPLRLFLTLGIIG